MDFDSRASIPHPEEERKEIFRGIKSSPEEARRALGVLFEETIPQAEPLSLLYMATGSGTKQELIRRVISPYGIPAKISAAASAIPEEEYKQVLRDLNTPVGKYAPRMSARKLIDFTEHLQKGEGCIALDTVVIPEDNTGRILEKPTTMDEAREMIRGLSLVGSVITVSDGVTLVSRLQNGEPFYYRTAANITLGIAPKTDEEINEYLDRQGTKVLNIAGGIDFASEAGSTFIDSTLPLIVSKGKAGEITSLTDSLSAKNLSESVKIDGSLHSLLIPDFQGVPEHAVSGVLRNFRHPERK